MFSFTNQGTKAQKYQVGCVGQNSFIAYLSKQNIFILLLDISMGESGFQAYLDSET